MSELRIPEQNTVLLTGRLTRDPELKYTASGTAMCRFGLAVNRRYKDPKSGEWKDDTTFVNCVIWREAGERVGKVVKKGSPVHVEGRLRSYDYQDKDGNKRSGIEIEARRVQILEKASSAGSTGVGEPEPSAGVEIEEVPF
ncbi:MAG: single-stranded DNA-binding protein [Elusimicrobia bacterium]|nr:single-stranded DNA-binding protein [Elusimicrobiota bacterium]